MDLLKALLIMPRPTDEETRRGIETMGIALHEDYNKYFVKCTFPAGWHASHRSGSYGQGIVRFKLLNSMYQTRLTYCLANDRADVNIVPRFEVVVKPSSKDNLMGVWGMDKQNFEVILISVVSFSDFLEGYELGTRKGAAWLAHQYPGQEQNPLAYWY